MLCYVFVIKTGIIHPCQLDIRIYPLW